MQNGRQHEKMSLKNYGTTIDFFFFFFKYRFKFLWNIRDAGEGKKFYAISVSITFCLVLTLPEKTSSIKQKSVCIYITSFMVDYCGQCFLVP